MNLKSLLPSSLHIPLGKVLATVLALVPNNALHGPLGELERAIVGEVEQIAQAGIGSVLSRLVEGGLDGLISLARASTVVGKVRVAIELMTPAKDGVVALSVTAADDGTRYLDARIFLKALLEKVGPSILPKVGALLDSIEPGASGGLHAAAASMMSSAPASATAPGVILAEFEGDPEIPCDCDPKDPAALPCGHPACHVNPYVPDHDYMARSEGDPCKLCGTGEVRHLALRPEAEKDVEV